VYAPGTWRVTCHLTGWHEYRVTLGLPDGSGYVRLASADPEYSRPLTTGISSIQRQATCEGRPAIGDETAGIRRIYRCGRSPIYPTNDILADDDAFDLWIRQIVGTARHVSGTCKMDLIQTYGGR